MCGITRKEREACETENRLRFQYEQILWKERADPDELPPGFPLTSEERVHAALFFLKWRDSLEKPTAQDFQRVAYEVHVDYNLVVKVWNYFIDTKECHGSIL